MAYGKILVDQVENSNGEVLSVGNGVRVFETASELQTSTTLSDSDIVIVKERANAEYEIQPSTYTALDGDITLANGQIAELIITDSLTLASFGAYLDGVTDDSDAVDASVSRLGTATVPAGYYIKYDLDPDYDTTVFLGDGKINTTDPWGYDHVFDVGATGNGSVDTARNTFNQKLFLDESVSIGFIGDSVTDRVYPLGDANPTDDDGNLSSTDYDHNANGGAESWPASARSLIVNCVRLGADVSIYNAASSGKKLIDGWGFRNFDYGFFQNAAYNNEAPDILVISMGINDTGSITDFDAYRKEFDKLINKAHGYGCSVCVASVNSAFDTQIKRSGSIVDGIKSSHPTVDYLDLGQEIIKAANSKADLISKFFIKSGVFDYIHATEMGIRVLGGAFVKYLMGDMVADLTSESAITAVGDVSMFAVRSDGAYPYPNPEEVSGLDYLDTLGSLRYFNSEGLFTTIRVPVWNENPDTTLTVLMHKYPEYEGTDSRYTTLRIFNGRYDINEDEDLFVQEDLFPTDYEFSDEYKSVQFNGLFYGFNIIDLTFSGGFTKIYAPTLIFSDYKASEKSTGYSRKDITSGSRVKLGVPTSYIGKENYTQSVSVDINRSAPAGISPSAYSRGSIEVVDLDGASMEFNSKPDAERCISFAVEGDDLVFRDFSGTLLATVTGDFTGEFTVSWTNFLVNTFIHTVDTLGATQTTSGISGGYSGGGVYINNGSADTATVIIKSTSIS